jgi:Cu(I)/Ag(I) efflux system membrane fusion protein
MWQTNDRLFEIGDFSRMWFVFDVYEADLAWVRAGQTVEIALASLAGQVLTAPITFIDPNLNETTRTARARVVLDNTNRQLLHRQTALARVTLESPETLLVPRSAVLQHGGHPVVFVDRGNRAYAARDIQLGRIGDTTAEVLAGLAEGDQRRDPGRAPPRRPGPARPRRHRRRPDHGTPAPSKVSAAEPAHDAAAYALLKTLAFSGADAAAALAADDLPAYQKNLPALRAAFHAYLTGYAPPPAARSRRSRIRSSTAPTSAPHAAPSSPSAPPSWTSPAPSTSTTAKACTSSSAR